MHSYYFIAVLLGAVVSVLSESHRENFDLFFSIPLPSGAHAVAMGQMLILDCEATGSPTPVIDWLHNGHRVAQGNIKSTGPEIRNVENAASDGPDVSLGLGSTRSRLFIDCMSPSDAGEYTCVAKTPKEHITSTVFLTTASPARIYMWTAQRLEYVGADVQLLCRSSGTPSPKVTWYDNDGNVIGATGEQYHVLNNGDLVIRRVNFLDNMGVYTCVVENPSGTDAVETFVYPTSP